MFRKGPKSCDIRELKAGRAEPQLGSGMEVTELGSVFPAVKQIASSHHPLPEAVRFRSWSATGFRGMNPSGIKRF